MLFQKYHYRTSCWRKSYRLRFPRGRYIPLRSQVIPDILLWFICLSLRLSSKTSFAYRINPFTFVATQVGNVLNCTFEGNNFGVDWNPIADLLRVISGMVVHVYGDSKCRGVRAQEKRDENDTIWEPKVEWSRKWHRDRRETGRRKIKKYLFSCLTIYPDTGKNYRVNVNTSVCFADTDISPAGVQISAVSYTNSYLGAQSTALYALDLAVWFPPLICPFPSSHLFFLSVPLALLLLLLLINICRETPSVQSQHQTMVPTLL